MCACTAVIGSCASTGVCCCTETAKCSVLHLSFSIILCSFIQACECKPVALHYTLHHYQLPTAVVCCCSLCERREEWRQAEEERKAAMPDPSVPPGHTLMPNKERLKTLQILRDSKSDCIHILGVCVLHVRKSLFNLFYCMCMYVHVY